MRQLYETQRAMRAIRQAALQRGVIAILDIGTSKIACLVLRFDGPDRFRESDGIGPMAGQSSFRVIGAATTRSRGVRFGEIDAMQETERAIRTAVTAAQKMANLRVDHAIVSLSGARPRSYGLDGVVEIDGGTVREGDIGRVLAACDMPDYGEDREVLHAHPVNFALDHRSGLADPRGQMGNRLTTDLHLLTVDASALQNILYAVKRCDLELAGIASSAYVAGLASLVEDEQELGAACIDMGGGSTSISIFMKKHMIYADAVRIGGDHVTSDISKGLQVPQATAERIKTSIGTARMPDDGRGASMQIRGRDLLNGVPKETEISQARITSSALKDQKARSSSRPLDQNLFQHVSHWLPTQMTSATNRYLAPPLLRQYLALKFQCWLTRLLILKRVVALQ